MFPWADSVAAGHVCLGDELGAGLCSTSFRTSSGGCIPRAARARRRRLFSQGVSETVLPSISGCGFEIEL
eukprot:scaffold53064_cov32-Tisochrysis_lutea.AAC.1